MKSFRITRGFALRLSVQAFRAVSGEDTQAIDRELELFFEEQEVPPEDQPRVRKELLENAKGVLMGLVMVYDASLTMSALPVTRELRLPDNADTKKAD